MTVCKWVYVEQMKLRKDSDVIVIENFGKRTFGPLAARRIPSKVFVLE